MPMNIPEQKYDDALLSAEDRTIIMSGEITSIDPAEFLSPFLEKAFSQADDAAELIIDITGLNFLNSSAIGCILKRLRKKKAGLKVTIKTDRKKMWQKTSVTIFKLVDPDNVTIE